MSQTTARALLLAALFGGLLAAQWDALRSLVSLWNHSPMYSYGYLVPVVSLWLLWSRREALSRVAVRPAPVAGAIVLAAWFGMLWAGRLTGVILLEQLALIAAIVGCVLWLRGAGWLKVAWASIAFLLLMMPIWDAFTEPLHLKFQNMSASLAVWMLQGLGVPSYRDGTFVYLPDLTLEVARACSGVNYLIAVIALGLPLAYLYLRSNVHRVLLVSFAVLVAALSNSLRVALIGIMAYAELGAPLHGPAHVLHGLFVSGIGHVALFAGLWLLTRVEQRRGIAPPPEAGEPAPRARFWPPILNARPLAVLALVFWAGAIFIGWYRVTPVSPRASLDLLSPYLGGWVADGEAERPAWWSGADHELHRRYRSRAGVASIHVAYFEAQRQNAELVSFRTLALHRIAEPVPVRLGTDVAMVNLVRQQTAHGQELTLFWYELNGRVESTAYSTKLRTLWNAVGRARNNGALVAIVADAGQAGQDTAAWRQQLDDLARNVHRGLEACLPGRDPAAAAHDVTALRTATGERRP